MTGIEVRQLDPQPVLSVRRTALMEQLTEAQDEALHLTRLLLRTRGIEPAGPPFVRYHTLSEVETDLEVGVPVPPGITGEGPVVTTELPGGPAITISHKGSHESLGQAYAEMTGWLKSNRESEGPGWEVYEWIDLRREPDSGVWDRSEDWTTQLVQPIAGNPE